MIVKVRNMDNHFGMEGVVLSLSIVQSTRVIAKWAFVSDLNTKLVFLFIYFMMHAAWAMRSLQCPIPYYLN